jgi:organic radical activating enzyme
METTALKNDNRPVVIFGAGMAGQVVHRAATEQGIEIECFCDDNIKKDNTTLCGVKIFHTSTIKDRYPDANFIISAADIHDMIDNLVSIGYSEDNLYSCVSLLKEYDLSKFIEAQNYNDEDITSGFVEFAVKCTLACQEGFGTPDKVFMRSVDIVVTEKCTMKCVDCSNLMQYFENPISYKASDMSEAIDLLSTYADEIHEFRVIGGEPFVNKEWHLVMDALVEKANVKRVAIYTNGTIMPREHQIPSLKDDKVIFMITDYSGCGDNASDKKTANLSRFKKQVDRLEDLCKREGIDYRRHPPENWTDCGRIEKFNRTVEENKEVFKSCCCKNLITLSEGELHRCPFSAQITRLGVSNFEDDYIVLAEKASVGEMKQRLRSFLFEKDYIEACEYCPGRRLSDSQILPAIQTKKVLPIIV